MPEQKQTYSGGGAFSNIGMVCLSSHLHKPQLRLFPMHLGATAVEPSQIYIWLVLDRIARELEDGFNCSERACSRRGGCGSLGSPVGAVPCLF